MTWKGRGWDRSFERLPRAGPRRRRPDPERASCSPCPRSSTICPGSTSRFATPSTGTPPSGSPRRGATGELPLEKDFSPTLAGDALADERARILRWLREVPGADPGRRAAPLRLALKLMNARFDDAFQREMMDAAPRADALVCFNRLWDARAGVAYGGWDLSERNLRVLRAARGKRAGPALVGTGNVCSGRVLLDYARAGCESVALHTLLPASAGRVPRVGGHPHASARCTRCCFIRSTGSWPGCWTSSATACCIAGRRRAAVSRPGAPSWVVRSTLRRCG